MSAVPRNRLESLRQLRDRIDLEIAAELVKHGGGASTDVAVKQAPPKVTDYERPAWLQDSTIRAWARANGVEVGIRGKVKDDVVHQYLRATAGATS